MKIDRSSYKLGSCFYLSNSRPYFSSKGKSRNSTPNEDLADQSTSWGHAFSFQIPDHASVGKANPRIRTQMKIDPSSSWGHAFTFQIPDYAECLNLYWKQIKWIIEKSRKHTKKILSPIQEKHAVLQKKNILMIQRRSRSTFLSLRLFGFACE